MKILSRFAFALVLASFLAQGQAHAKKEGGAISMKYAKSLISKEASSKGFWHRWTSTVGQPVGPGLRAASARPNFGKRPHIMTVTGGATSLVAVPSYVGTINMTTGKGAPTGKARVSLMPAPIPLNAAGQ